MVSEALGTLLLARVTAGPDSRVTVLLVHECGHTTRPLADPVVTGNVAAEGHVQR